MKATRVIGGYKYLFLVTFPNIIFVYRRWAIGRILNRSSMCTNSACQRISCITFVCSNRTLPCMSSKAVFYIAVNTIARHYRFASSNCSVISTSRI